MGIADRQEALWRQRAALRAGPRFRTVLLGLGARLRALVCGRGRPGERYFCGTGIHASAQVTISRYLLKYNERI